MSDDENLFQKPRVENSDEKQEENPKEQNMIESQFFLF